jgi:ribose 5-phosphate isomerase A
MRPSQAAVNLAFGFASLAIGEMDSSNRAEVEKRLAARAAAALVEDGMAVGLGTGSTVAHLLPALAARDLDVRCVATSPATEEAAERLGIRVGPFDGLDRLDIAIDGADQVTPEGWLVKGGGGAHLREKIVAAAAARFIVIVDSAKPVPRLRPPIPLELYSFGIESTVARLGAVELREAAPSPDGGVIADYLDDPDDPAALAAWLAADPGVAAHGLFEPELVSEVLVGRGDEVDRLSPTGARRDPR